MNAQVTNPQPDDDDMPSEVDFSNAVRGKFYKPNMRLIPPVRLEPEVLNFLVRRAELEGVTLNALLNTLLKKAIERMQAADALLSVAGRVETTDVAPMSMQEINAQVKAARAARVRVGQA
jgi:hypothetical protein